MEKSFDTKKYFLGRLCALQHEFESTGKCLREIAGRHTCKVCRKLGRKIVTRLLSRKNAQKPAIKQWRKEYNKKQKFSEARIRATKKYSQSEKCKKTKLKYNQTKKNKTYQKEYMKKYSAIPAHQEKAKQRKLAYVKTAKTLANDACRAQIQRTILHPHYIKQLLRKSLNIEREDITLALIILKREQLQLTRGLRLAKKEIKDGTIIRSN